MPLLMCHLLLIQSYPQRRSRIVLYSAFVVQENFILILLNTVCIKFPLKLFFLLNEKSNTNSFQLSVPLFSRSSAVFQGLKEASRVLKCKYRSSIGSRHGLALWLNFANRQKQNGLSASLKFSNCSVRCSIIHIHSEDRAYCEGNVHYFFIPGCH